MPKRLTVLTLMITMVTCTLVRAQGVNRLTPGDVIQGLVVRTDTSEPIPGAQVTATPARLLTADGRLRDEPYDPSLIVRAVTDANGHFVLNGVPEGILQLRAEHDGFRTPERGGGGSTPWVSLIGQNPPMRLRLEPRSRVYGRVLSSDGRPASKITVEAAVIQPAMRNGRRIAYAIRSTETSEQGEFDLHWLDGGEYYLRARAAGPTYWPGVSNLEDAKPVKIIQGKDLPADITLQQYQTGTLSGEVDLSRIQPSSLSLYLVPHRGLMLDDLSLREVQDSAPRQTPGHFILAGVPYGSYDLFATGLNSSGGVLAGRTPVDVAGADITDIKLALEETQQVSGKVSVRDADSTTLRGVTVQLQSLDALPSLLQTPSEPVAPDGTFVFRNLSQGKYGIVLSGLPPNTYVSDIRVGEVSVYDGVVNVPMASAPLQIAVERRGQALNGIVKNADDKGTPATVVLVPQGASNANFTRYQLIHTGSWGQFEFRGLAAGQYLIFACEGTPSLTLEGVRRYLSRAQPIEIGAGAVPSLVIHVAD